jgi:diguanylate cyclase (GGDEF)-like protein
MNAFIEKKEIDRLASEHAKLKRELALSTALIDLTNELLSATLDSGFYRMALERMINLVPDAQGGSVLIRRAPECFGFAAAIDFDFGTLEGIELSLREINRKTEREVERLTIQDFEAALSDEKTELFRMAGRYYDIKSTLSVPIVIRDRVEGFLNLDNFEDRGAFGPYDVTVSKAIASQIGVALHRLSLEKSLAEEKAKYEVLANHDSLTGLPNRRLFQDRLEQSLAQARRSKERFSLLFLDLDGFKGINDSYGHDAGDELLRDIGQGLMAAVRASDTVARMGGDEFAAILHNVDGVETSMTVADKLGAAVRAAGAGERRVGVSIGLALWPDHGETADELMEAADRAMYCAKEGGKNAILCAVPNDDRREPSLMARSAP